MDCCRMAGLHGMPLPRVGSSAQSSAIGDIWGACCSKQVCVSVSCTLSCPLQGGMTRHLAAVDICLARQASPSYRQCHAPVWWPVSSARCSLFCWNMLFGTMVATCMMQLINNFMCDSAWPQTHEDSETRFREGRLSQHAHSHSATTSCI